jgi:HK97 family phage major capsid protein
MLKPVNSWKAIRDLLTSTGSRPIGAPRASAQMLVELDKEIADLFAESKKITDRAGAENRDLNDAEMERMNAILDEDTGEIETLQAERAKVAKVLALKKRQARGMQEMERNRYSGLVSADENPDDDEDDEDEGDNEDDDEDEDKPKMKTSKSANRLTKASRRPKLKDASGKRMRVAMGGERLFPIARSNGFGDDERPRMEFADSLRAHIRGESSQLTSVGGNGGFLVPEIDSGILLDRVRAASIFDKINTASVELQAPETYITQVLEDPTAHWEHELAVTKASSVSFGRLNMRACKVRCLIPLSAEFIEDSVNGAATVQQVAIRAMASAIDRALLMGSGVGPEPMGVLNSVGVQTVDAVGFPADDSKFSAGVGKIMQADFPGAAGELSLVMNPAIAGVMDNLRDGENRPLPLTPWVGAMPKYVSSSLPSTLGDADDESEACILHGPSILVGFRRQLEGRLYDQGVAVDEGGNRYEAPSQDVRFLVLSARVGIAILRPSWQCVLGGILAVDPE